MDNIKSKVLSGGLFHGISNILQQLFAVVVSIVLARNLEPSAFGMIAIVTAYTGFVAMFTNIGLGASVIQNKDVTQEQLSTLYWLSITLFFITWLIVVLTSGLVTQFYNIPELTGIILVMSVSILLRPLYVMQERMLEKSLLFSLLAVINIISSLVGGVSAIVAVYLGMGVYSLVALTLVNAACRMALILYFKRWSPDRHFNFEEVENMIWFSVKYKGASVVDYLGRNVDTLIIGKLFDAFSLGLYSFAYTIMYAPVKRIAYVFTQILFPSLSLLQDNSEKMTSAYLQSIRLIAIVSFPAMTILSLNAEWLIPMIFGDHWLTAIPIVQVLCYAGAIQSVTQISGTIYHATGNSEVPMYLGLVKVVMIVGAIFAGSTYGLYEVAVLLLVVSILSFLINNTLISRKLEISYLLILGYLKGPLLSAFVIVGSYNLLEHYRPIGNEIFVGIVSAAFGLLLLLYINHDVLKDLFRLITVKMRTGLCRAMGSKCSEYQLSDGMAGQMEVDLAASSEEGRSDMLHIYWISPNLNHYKKKFLSRLVKNEEIDLVILAGQSPSKDGHQEDEGVFPFRVNRVSITKRWFGIYLPAYWEILKAVVGGKYDAIMMPAEKRLLLLILWLFVLKLFCRFKLVTYTHPYMRSQLNRVTENDLFWTRLIFALFDRVIFYTAASRNWALERRLLPNSKADYANNTLNTEEIKENYNFEVNLEKPQRILFIGRLVESKRLDVLLHYFRELKKEIPNLKLSVIGDGPESDVIKDGMKMDNGITWLGSVIDETRISIEMRRSQIVLVPGWSGLSVVHAFAYGKPYVTLTGMTHAPEISYLIDGINGYLLSGSEKENIAKLRELFANKEKYSEMCRHAYQTAQGLSVDKWCKRIANALRTVVRKSN